MADRYRGYADPYAHDRDPRGGYSECLPSGSTASYYASRPSVLPGGPDVLRNDVALQPRAYGLDGPGGVINPTLPVMNGLPAVARAHVPSPLEDPSFAGMRGGLAPARAPGPSPSEDLSFAGMRGLASARAPGPNPSEDLYFAGMRGLAPARAPGPSPSEDLSFAGMRGLASARAPGPSPSEDLSFAGMRGLAPARAPGPSASEDLPFAGMSGLAPARAPGPSLLEEPAVVGRSSSLGKGAGIPNVEHHSPLPNLDGPSEDESNILFVDCLPTDCTRREVAHLFRLFDGFKDIRVVHKEPRRSGDKAYVLCFVEFDDAKSARVAMEKLRGYRFDDRKPDSPLLQIHFARFPFRLPAAHDDRERLIRR